MRITAVVLGGALLAAGVCGVTSDAGACGFVSYRDVKVIDQKPAPKVAPKPIPLADQVAAAEQRLEAEHPHDAAVLAVGAFPHIRTRHVGESPLGDHAMRILSLAIVRSDGRTWGVSGFPGSTVAERDANVAWAVTTLRAVQAARADDPVSSSQLGEALAARPGTEGEAVTILADLAARDLIGSAHAYAALARLVAKNGEAPRTRALLARCEAMTHSAATVCRVPEATVAAR